MLPVQYISEGYHILLIHDDSSNIGMILSSLLLKYTPGLCYRITGN